MKILLDHCVDRRLKRHLSAHQVQTAREKGWDSLKNGQLLDQAQAEFEVLLTVDRNIQHQQNLTGRSIAIVVLVAVNNRLATLLPLLPELETLLPTVQPGHVYEVSDSGSECVV